MYRRPKFLEILLEIREEMAREADYDTDLFAELVRTEPLAGVPNEDHPAEKTAKRRGQRAQANEAAGPRKPQ